MAETAKNTAILSENKLYPRAIFTIGLLFSLVIIFFWKFIFLGFIPINADWLLQWSPWASLNKTNMPYNPDVSDPLIFIYPIKFLQSHLLKNGIFPLWNNYIFCGNPLFANGQSDVFNPLNIIFFIFSPARAFGYLLMMQMFLAGAFMYLFLKTLNIGHFGRLIGSIVYMLNGFVCVYLQISTVLGPYLCLPLLFLFFEKALSCGKLKFLIFMAITFAVSLFSELQMTCYSFIALFCYAIFKSSSDKEKGRKVFSPRPLLFLSAVFAIGVLLSAVQILPVSEFSALSHRNLGLPRYFSINYFPWYQLITFFIPNALGHPVDYNLIQFSGRDYLQLCGYIGALPLMMSIGTFFITKDKTACFFAYLGFGTLLFLLMFNFSFLRVFMLKILPAFHTLYHVRLLYIFVFSGAVLSGFFVDHLMSAHITLPRLMVFLKYAYAAFFLSFSLLVLVNGVFTYRKAQLADWGKKYVESRYLKHANRQQPSEYYEKKIDDTVDKLQHHLSIKNPNVIVPFLLFFLGLSLLYLFGKNMVNPATLKLAVFTLICFDLISFGWKYNTFASPATVYPQNKAIDFLKADKEIFRVSGLGRVRGNEAGFKAAQWGVMPPDTNIPYEIQIIGGYDSLHLARYKDFFSLIQKEPYANQNILYDHSSKLLNLLNLKYILSSGGLTGDNLELVYDKEMKIYKNNDYLPRVFLVPEVKVIRDKSEILDELASNRFDPKGYVILEEDPGKVSCGSGASMASSHVEIRRYSALQVDIFSSLETCGFLVFLDSYYPGWRAYVDGKEVKIYQANYLFRALHLDKGSHAIKFIFKPLSVMKGAAISLFSLAAIAFIFIFMRHKTV